MGLFADTFSWDDWIKTKQQRREKMGRYKKYIELGEDRYVISDIVKAEISKYALRTPRRYVDIELTLRSGGVVAQRVKRGEYLTLVTELERARG